MGSIPGPGRFHMPVQLRPCTTITEPVLWTQHAISPECYNYRSSRTERLCSTTREATAVRSLNTASKSGHRSLQLEKAFTQQQRPSTAKNKSVKLFFLKNKNMISKNSFKKVYPWSPTQPSLLAGHCHLYKPTRQGWCGLTGKKNTWPTYKLTQRYKTNNSLALKFWYCIQHGFFFFIPWPTISL